MISVDDVASAMLLAWRAEVGGGRAFILTDRVAYSTRQIYDMIRQALGRRTSGFVIPPFVFSAAAQVGDVVGALLGRRVFFDSHAFDRVAGSAYFDSSRALRELGFVPTTTLREVMPALVRSVVHERATRSTE
jgi:nucleoside-diphosphate-sugar epimerase